MPRLRSFAAPFVWFLFSTITFSLDPLRATLYLPEDEVGPRCRALLRHLIFPSNGSSFFMEQANYFLVRPGDKKSFIGILAETEANVPVLGLAPYYSEHANLLHQFRKAFGDPSRILWGGEVRGVNRSPQPDLIIVEQVNDTSNYIHGLSQTPREAQFI